MENRIVITENKILEHNEKAYNDTIQLASISHLAINNVVKAVQEIGDNYLNALTTLHFDKGRVIWVEFKVEDSFLSGKLMEWLYSKSKYDEGALHALGCSVQQIMFQKPSGYTAEEKEAIKRLYEKAFGL